MKCKEKNLPKKTGPIPSPFGVSAVTGCPKGTRKQKIYHHRGKTAMSGDAPPQSRQEGSQRFGKKTGRKVDPAAARANKKTHAAHIQAQAKGRAKEAPFRHGKTITIRFMF